MERGPGEGERCGIKPDPLHRRYIRETPRHHFERLRVVVHQHESPPQREGCRARRAAAREAVQHEIDGVGRGGDDPISMTRNSFYGFEIVFPCRTRNA